MRGVGLVKRTVAGAARTALRILPGYRWEKIEDRVCAIEGLLMQGQEEWLFRVARQLPNNATIVEIGAFKGRSTCSLAYGCVGSDRHIFSIDTFCGNDTDFTRWVGRDGDGHYGYYEDWAGNLGTRGLAKYAKGLRGYSRDFYSNWSLPIDLLFIDGSHQYEDVLSDFESFFVHVVPGGIIALHDVIQGWDGPYRVWHEHVRARLVDTGTCASIAYGRKPLC